MFTVYHLVYTWIDNSLSWSSKSPIGKMGGGTKPVIISACMCIFIIYRLCEDSSGLRSM